ncbi:hypothetical protein F5Y03DRAFT_392923 [Xylaria venustula]|nr:hypothetical protein F5Y03DRAFT_392923 [Xylaria venustula]
MDRNYVPPFRRRVAGDADAPPLEHEHHSSQSYQNTHHSNQVTSRGPKQGSWGYGRGGRGGYKKDFFKKQNPQIDQSDLYREADIHNYFWGSENDAGNSHSSTFRDAKDRRGELSHMLLFFGANPRWANDRIVFAKSKLTLLPEYAAKKAENGEWETEAKAQKDAASAEESVGDGGIERKDVLVVADDHETEARRPAGGATVADNTTLSCPFMKRQKQDPKAGKSDTEKDTAVSIAVPKPADEDHEYQIKQERPQEGDLITTQDSTTGIQQPNSSHQPKADETNNYILEKNTNNEEGYGQHTIVKVERTSNQEVQTTPISNVPSTKTASHPKYTDIRKDKAESIPTPNQPPSKNSRMKYTDIRLETATSFYKKHERSHPEPERTFPAIAPIEYEPSTEHAIAAFEERRIPGLRTGASGPRFAFKGWFRISRVNILAPGSAELVRMLRQKWERKDRYGNVVGSKTRDASAWDSSLAHEWAVVRFEVLEGVPPQIEKLPDVDNEGRETKSVNKMLEEMRLNDGNKDRLEGEDLGERVDGKSEESSSTDPHALE